MPENNSFLHHPLAIFNRPFQGWLNSVRTLWAAGQIIYTRPFNVFIALLSTFLSIGVCLWLSNIGLVQVVFESNVISASDKFIFLLEMYQIGFRVAGNLQLLLIGLVGITVGIQAGFWLYEARYMKGLSHGEATPGLVLAVFGAAISMFGLILTIPLLKREGLVVGAEGHILGSILAICGFLICIRACVLLARAIISREK
jgi:hypothetical protein